MSTPATHSLPFATKFHTITNRVITFTLLVLALFLFTAITFIAFQKTGLWHNTIGSTLLHWFSSVSVVALCILFVGALLDALLTHLLSVADNPQKSGFETIIQNVDASRLLSVLHTMIDGKGGRDVGLVLGAALWKYHYLTRIPTESQFMTEFPTVTTKWRAIKNQISTPLPNGQDAFSQSIRNIEINI